MRSPLDPIEARLQDFVENRLAGLLPWGGSTQLAVAHQLIQSLRASIRTTPTGQPAAPHRYTLLVHPDRQVEWQAGPGLIQSLESCLARAAAESGIVLGGQPSVQVQGEPRLGLNEFSVVPNLSSNEQGDTAVMEVDGAPPRLASEIPPGAYLVFPNQEILPLAQSVINIGRRRENQIAIDDPRVSRSHAQLRAVQGQYLLFDLNSTGGTFVNGTRITRHTLKSGDVISLAGVTLIYGHDPTGTTDVRHYPGTLASGSTQSFSARDLQDGETP